MRRAMSSIAYGCASGGNCRSNGQAFTHFQSDSFSIWKYWAQTPRYRIRQISMSTFSTLTAPKAKEQKQGDSEASKRIISSIMSCGKKGDWMEILQIHQRTGEDFNAVNYSIALNQLSKIKTVRRQHPRLESLVEGVSVHLKGNPLEWIVRNKVMTLHAIAKLRLDFPAAGVAINSILQDAVVIAERGNPQDIANTVWAVATMGIESPLLFEAINTHPACIIADGTPQEIANTAWAFATLKSDGKAFFGAVDECASRLVREEGTPQNIANTVWAFASRGMQAPSLCLQIEEHAVSIVSRGDSQNISNIVWSFATMGVACPNLCHAVDQDASRLIQNGDSQSLANTLWALSILGVDSPRLLEAIRNPEVASHVGLQDTQGLLNICYALAISDSFPRHSDTFAKFWKQANECDWNELSYRGRNQLVQSYLIATCVHRLKLSRPKWCTTPLTTTVHESKAQAEMSKILEEVEFHHEKEVSPFGSNTTFNFWSIDCACRDRKIAIEFDGPSHFLRLAGSRESGDIENGPTKAKRRFLTSLGWKVINVSHLEWAQARTREGKRKLLSKRLKSVL
jgi:very-short-patch-repair endonuclease